MDYFQDKIILLTGASSGIGEALAVAMCKRGAKVGLLARRIEKLKSIVESIEEFGGIAHPFEADVRNQAELEEAAAELIKLYGRIDILIANAGIGGNNAATRNLEAEAVNKVININLLGSVNSIAAVLPHMKEQGFGQLVAVASLAGIRGLPRSAAYSASKAGMIALFESIRLDIQTSDLTVTIIQPGFIKTPLTSGRASKMPFLMELDDAIPLFLTAIEKKKKFASFPWQLALVVRAARFFPAFLYDRIAGRAKFRE